MHHLQHRPHFSDFVPKPVLAAKKVHANIKNLGPGIAQNVELSAAYGSGTANVPYASLAFWTPLARDDGQHVTLGDTNSLAQYGWVRCRVAFSSQFGSRQPVEVVFKP